MKIIFFGTPKFSADILSYLFFNKVDIVAVIPQPDHIRNKKIEYPEVKKIAKNYLEDLDIYQPEKASDKSFIDELKKYNADLFVVAAYGQILKQELLDIPKLDCINVHASLLPKYRGASPIRSAILNGDKKTGITIMKMVLKMDSGPIIEQKEIEITQGMNFSTLEEELCSISKPLLLDIIKRYERNEIIFHPQDETKVSYAPKVTKELREINFENTSSSILNKVLAFANEPGAFCKISINNEIKELKIFKIKLSDIKLKPKELNIINKSILVGTSDGCIELIEVQLEGKNKMAASNFIHGLKNSITIC